MTRRLRPVSETASLDAQLLLAHVLGANRSWVLAHPEATLTEEQQFALEAGARRLEAGEPLPYLLGQWEFYGLDFIVTPAVLIPRPETELLVEQALGWLHSRYSAETIGACRAADIGCGSGCVAIALAKNFPGLAVTAADLSPEALAVARRNVARHGLDGQVTLAQADLLPEAPPIFDLICANLPYIPTARLAELPVARWEPHLALDGGPDGLELIRRLLGQATGRLVRPGLLLLEIESSQGKAAGQLARDIFPAASVEVLVDTAGLDRLLIVRVS